MGKPKKKTRNPGVGVDFKRVKHKVGKKLPRARNETETDFKSRSINLPNQAVREDRSNVAVNYQNLTLKELLNQTSHHNDKSRKHSLIGLANLFSRHPEQLRLHASQVLGTLAERIVDGDSGVRSALRELLNDSLLPVLGADALRPFMPVVMAHVCGAMTHLSLDVRNDALLFLDVMMNHVPHLVVDGFLAPCMAHFCDLFSAAHRSRSIRAQSLAALTKLLTALTSFLGRAFPEDTSSPQPAAATARGPAAALDSSRTADGSPPSTAAAAGPGPSSVRHLHQQQLLRTQAALRTLWTPRMRGPLGADRYRRPLRSAGDLVRQMDELFRTAAGGLSRSGRKSRSGDGEVDQGRHKKGRGSVSTTEMAAGSAARGGRDVAAAAAALAVVTAAGDYLSAPSGSPASGLLGASTTMAAALAAASDSRASALRLVSLLMDCWLECHPSQLPTSPELEQTTALAMIASSCNSLMERLLPSDRYLHSHSHQQRPAPSESQHLALTQKLHDIVVRRVSAHFPAVMPPVKPPGPVVDALVRLNLQVAQLLGRFLPLISQSQGQGGQGPTAAPLWVPVLVSYYVSALEEGTLLPVALRTLSGVRDSSGAGTWQGLPAAAESLLLTAVSAALGQLQFDNGAAARLMAAVTTFSSRQSPRSPARLTCIRMQHSLLRTAMDGRLFLLEGVVNSWLEPLPRLMWEAGGAVPELSAAALTMMMDAARFAAPGSSMGSFIVSWLQPKLAPLFAVQMPPKAAKTAVAKRAAADAGIGSAPSAVQLTSEPDGLCEVIVLLPGTLSHLPDHVASLGVDLVYHLGALGGPLLKPLAAVLSSTVLPTSLALRLVDVVLTRFRDAPDPGLAASWLLTLLFGPQHGLQVLSPDGADLTAGWGRQRTLVDAVVMGLGSLGGASSLLLVLAPHLAALPLAVAATAGVRGSRLQRYSFVRLCAAALGEGSGKQLLPAALAEQLSAAAALSGVEAGAAEVKEMDAAGEAPSWSLSYRSTFGAVIQLLTERPLLITPLVGHLAKMLREASAAIPPMPLACVGSLPLHSAALAAVHLTQMAVKLPPVRTELGGTVSEREALVSAVQELLEAVRQLPVAAGSDHGASCGLESQRLSQMVADMYGSKASIGL